MKHLACRQRRRSVDYNTERAICENSTAVHLADEMPCLTRKGKKVSTQPPCHCERFLQSNPRIRRVEIASSAQNASSQ